MSSRVRLSRQCMYWPCQQGYFCGEVAAYAPGKRETRGSTRPASVVSHCYIYMYTQYKSMCVGGGVIM